jgi:FtsP/CotA-like multicopper oxidase with cupredoxin domain
LLTRRRFAQMAGMTSAAVALGQMKMPAGQPTAPPIPANAPVADFTLDIAPYLLEASPKHRFPTVAYNGQVPGPLLRMKQGMEVSIDIHNHSEDADIVHWHGLFLPVPVDGAMEEGSPMIPPGASTRITFVPDPAGFRWFHTHTFAGNDLRKAQFGGEHGFLLIEPQENPAPYDHEVFLALHDWGGRMMTGADGSAMPVYDVSTVNGKMLGFGEPVRVKQGERVMLHVLNSSPTEVHWVALAGHHFQVLALDGNAVPQPRTVEMLRLAPAERVSAIVEMNAPGVWVLGEVRKHVQAAGMGIVDRVRECNRRAEVGTAGRPGVGLCAVRGLRRNRQRRGRHRYLAGLRLEVRRPRQRGALDDQRQVVPGRGVAGAGRRKTLSPGDEEPERQ